MDFDHWLTGQKPKLDWDDWEKFVKQQSQDVGDWFFGLPADYRTVILLDAAVIRKAGSGYEARCCCCDEWTELPVGPEEIDVSYKHYCGGSPRCCP